MLNSNPTSGLICVVERKDGDTMQAVSERVCLFETLHACGKRRLNWINMGRCMHNTVKFLWSSVTVLVKKWTCGASFLCIKVVEWVGKVVFGIGVCMLYV